jgi:hypothetical protein
MICARLDANDTVDVVDEYERICTSMLRKLGQIKSNFNVPTDPSDQSPLSKGEEDRQEDRIENHDGDPASRNQDEEPKIKIAFAISIAEQDGNLPTKGHNEIAKKLKNAAFACLHCDEVFTSERLLAAHKRESKTQHASHAQLTPRRKCALKEMLNWSRQSRKQIDHFSYAG